MSWFLPLSFVVFVRCVVFVRWHWPKIPIFSALAWIAKGARVNWFRMTSYFEDDARSFFTADLSVMFVTKVSVLIIASVLSQTRPPLYVFKEAVCVSWCWVFCFPGWQILIRLPHIHQSVV
jgi:hypothetical protein